MVSGTALIRPDFPELLEFPFLWQQTEYVLGGGSSHYMFLVLAAQQLLEEVKREQKTGASIPSARPIFRRKLQEMPPKDTTWKYLCRILETTERTEGKTMSEKQL